MDFDKIKKAAKDTLKIVSNKVDEKFSETEDNTIKFKPKKNETVISDIDDFSQENNDFLGATRKFDIKSSLESLKKRQDGYEGNLSDILNTKNESSSNTEQSSNRNIFDVVEKNSQKATSEPSPAPSCNNEGQISSEINGIKKSLQKIDEHLDALTVASRKLEDDISELSQSMDEIYNIDKKLSDINSSLAGVNKITDSIFDLKNSQINTKNTLSDMEVSFRRLKKKMTSGVVIISIILALVAVLEVINLLS